MSSLADLPELVGFFSYSREDDEGMKGALSALRDGIQRELSAQLGRSKSNFRLWQDHEAIAPGRLWESEITSAIEQSVFFVPMVTPRVIRSKHCKFEFESFLAREKALGRSDLVFPILYMTVAALEDEAQWRNDPLLSIIGKRQYVDWRQFRHLDPQQTTVREAIERFCSKIVAALDRPIPAAGQVADPRILALHAAEEEERAKQGAENERRIEAERLAQETRRRDEAAERLRQEQDERLATERRKAQEAAEAQRQREAQRAAAEAERLRQEQDERLAAERREAQEAAEAQRQREAQRAAAEAERLRQEQDEQLAAERRKAQEAAEAQRQREAQRAAAEAERLRQEQDEQLAAERRKAQEAAEAQRKREAQRAATEAERLRQEQDDKLAAERRREQEAAVEARRMREKEEAREVERRRERKPEPAIDPASIGPAVPTAAPTLARRLLETTILPLLLLLAWQLGSMSKAIYPLLLPAPTAIVAAWFARLASGELPGDAVSTLLRFLLGAVVGTVPALAFGQLLTTSLRIRVLMNPLLRFLSATPAVAFLPVSMIMLGIGLGTGVAVTAIAIFFPVLASVMAHGASEPADAPPLTQNPGLAMSWGIPFALAFAFSAAIASEMVAPGGGGLGVKLVEFANILDMSGFFAVVLTLALLAAAINAVAARTSGFVSDNFFNRAATRPHAPERSRPEIASDAPLWRRLMRGAAAPVLLIVLWQTAAALGLDSLSFPSPAKIVAEWFRNLESIASHAGGTVLRLIGGVLLSLMPALALMRLMEAQPRICGYLLPLVRTMGAIPAVVWVPLATLWFGIGPRHILFATAVGAFFPVLLRMTAGPGQPAGRAASGLIAPVRGSDVLAGVMVAVRFAFMVLLAAEYFASTDGLGYLMMVEAQQFDTALVFAALITIGLVGLALESAVALIIGRAFGIASTARARVQRSS